MDETGWMDGCIEENVWSDLWTIGWIYRCWMDEWKDRWINALMALQTYNW